MPNQPQPPPYQSDDFDGDKEGLESFEEDATPVPVIDHSRQLASNLYRSTARRRFAPSTSFLDIFDFSFKKYVTPWVVRATWALAVLTAAIYLLLGAFFLVASLAPSDAARMQNNAAQYQARPRQDPAPVLEVGLPDSVTPIVWRVIGIATLVEVLIIALLWIRVALECVIVVFDISQTLARIESHAAK